MLTRSEFIDEYFPLTRRLTSGTGIFPSIMIATAIIESQREVNGTYYPGQSLLAKTYNNYFGIKADSSWEGQRVKLWTTEVIDGVKKKVQRYFRVYGSLEESFENYVQFLLENPRYKEHKVFSASTIEEQAERIKAAGYATGTNYATLLVAVAKSAKEAGTSAQGWILALVSAYILFSKK